MNVGNSFVSCDCHNASFLTVYDMSMETLLIKKTRTLSKRKLDMIRSDVTDVYDSYKTGLSKRALYKTNDIEVGHDLIQTTFLKTLSYLQKGGKIDVMRSFLNHILNDLIIDKYGENKTSSFDAFLEKGFESDFDDNKRITDIFDSKQIVLLIPLLPKKYQLIMHMRYMQNLSLKEMSLITGQQQNTVAVQAHRGLEKLKILYAESHK